MCFEKYTTRIIYLYILLWPGGTDNNYYYRYQKCRFYKNDTIGTHYIIILCI